MAKGQDDKRTSRLLPAMPISDYVLFAECFALMLAMALAVSLCSFDRLKSLASRPLAARRLSKEKEDRLLRRMRWAIAAAARRSPLRSLCFEQGLVAQIMLRRRGVDSRLFYGLAASEKVALHAHVWVRAGDFPICGAGNASDFANLLVLPPIPNETG